MQKYRCFQSSAGFWFFQLLRGSKNLCRCLSFIRIEMWARFPFGVEKAKILCEEVANLSTMLCRFCYYLFLRFRPRSSTIGSILESRQCFPSLAFIHTVAK